MAKGPKLQVGVGANVDDFEKKFERVKKTADRQLGNVEKRGRKFSSKFEKDITSGLDKISGRFAAFGKGLLGGLAVGGVTGAVAALRQVAGSVAEISNEAARAGVTTKVFQEWTSVAQQARIPVDAMADAFKELNIRADEFATTGKGSAAEAFERLGLTPAEVKAKLKDPAELMLLILERTRRLGEASAQTRVLDETLGGTGAEKFAALLGQSNDEIRQTIDQAHALGNVLDDDVIRAAAEVDKQFNIIVHTVGTNLRGAIVSAYTALTDFINAFNGFDAERSVKLDQRMASLGKERLEVEQKIFEIRNRTDGLAGDGILGTSIGDSGTLGGIADQARRLEAIAAEEAMILKVLEARKKLETPPATTGGGWTPSPYTPPATKSGGRDKAAAQAEREAEAVRRLIGELEHELRLVGATDLQRETANALRRAGAAATAEQEAKIISLVAAIHAEEEATRKATEAAQELRDVGRDVLGGFINDMVQGKSAADALASALQNVANRLLNSGLDALFGGKGIGGHIGRLSSTNFSGANH